MGQILPEVNTGKNVINCIHLTNLFEVFSAGNKNHIIYSRCQRLTIVHVNHAANASPFTFTDVIRLQSFYCHFKFFLYNLLATPQWVFPPPHTHTYLEPNVFNFCSYDAGLTLKDCWSQKSVTLALLMGSHCWYMTLKCNIYNQLYLLVVGVRREVRAAGLHKHQDHTVLPTVAMTCLD